MYAALSYEGGGGDSKTLKSVMLDDRPWPMREDLWLALSNSRYSQDESPRERMLCVSMHIYALKVYKETIRDA